MSKAFTCEENINSFIDCGYIDALDRSTPDVYGIMNSFNLGMTPERRSWFLSMVEKSLIEYSKRGKLEESFFDANGVVLDKDDNYPLVNPSLITSRSCDPYHAWRIALTRKKIDDCKQKKSTTFHHQPKI